MASEIRHRRLSAFYRSKVLNGLMIAVVTCLLLMAYSRDTAFPVICGALALLLFIAYTPWIWVKKPGAVVINDWLSDINGYYTLYFLLAVGFGLANPWWYITPVALAIIPLFIALTGYKDQRFDI